MPQLKVLQLLIKANMWPVRSAIQSRQREGELIIHAVRIAWRKREREKKAFRKLLLKCYSSVTLQWLMPSVHNPQLHVKKGNFWKS